MAASVLEISDFIFDDRLLESIWNQHRGRCYEDVLSFTSFLRLMRDALIRHGGSAHKLFVDLESRKAQPVDESNFYRKLARTPVDLSRALLRKCTQRLSQLLPEPVVQLPGCFDDLAVIAGDGKTIKNAAKRLQPTRGYVGKLLGAKALVAIDLRSGLAIAMSDSLDGMSHEVPLLWPPVYEVVGRRPIPSVWDRQFDDLRTLGRLSARECDAFVVRMKQKQMPFTPESAVKGKDALGPRVLDETGLLGRGKQAMRVRRITLFRNSDEGEDDVVLLTNLLDSRRSSAADLLELYRLRWDIEEVFQQVTQTFSLAHLIGSRPQAVLLQFSFCLLLYNLMQVPAAGPGEGHGGVAAGAPGVQLPAAPFPDATAGAGHGKLKSGQGGPCAAPEGTVPGRRGTRRGLTLWKPVEFLRALGLSVPVARSRVPEGPSQARQALSGEVYPSDESLGYFRAVPPRLWLI